MKYGRILFPSYLEIRRAEILAEMDEHFQNILSEMGEVDKETLAKLRSLVSDYYNAKANLATQADVIVQMSADALADYELSLQRVNDNFSKNLADIKNQFLGEIVDELPDAPESEEPIESIPTFNLSEMGMGVITETDSQFINTDTTEMLDALENGCVKFILSAVIGEDNVTIEAVMHKGKLGSIHECTYTFTHDTKILIVTLMMTPTMVFAYLTNANNESTDGAVRWNDITDRPFGDNEDGSVTTLDAKYLPMDAIDSRIDAYIEEALGGDY